jgi:hypothetical protein
MMLQFGSSEEGLGKPWQPGQKRFNRVVFIGAATSWLAYCGTAWLAQPADMA